MMSTFLLKYYMFLGYESSHDKAVIFQWLHIEISLVVEGIKSEYAKIQNVPIKKLKSFMLRTFLKVHIYVKVI